MFKKFIYAIIVIALSSLLFNCSTMFNSGPQKVTVETKPLEAHILIKANTGQVFYDGKAPTEVLLPRSYTYIIEISMDGYQQQILPITHNVQGWFWGNLLCGGVIGMVIDGVTGNMWELEPTVFEIKLKTAMIETETGPAVVFLTKDDNNELRYITVPLIKA